MHEHNTSLKQAEKQVTNNEQMFCVSDSVVLTSTLGVVSLLLLRWESLPEDIKMTQHVLEWVSKNIALFCKARYKVNEYMNCTEHFPRPPRTPSFPKPVEQESDENQDSEDSELKEESEFKNEDVKELNEEKNKDEMEVDEDEDEDEDEDKVEKEVQLQSNSI